MPEADTRADRLRALLNQAFTPVALNIVDDSARHAGHAGARAGGQTHYIVHMTAGAFTNLSRVERQRAVNNVLRDEFASGLHALSLVLRAPDELPS